VHSSAVLEGPALAKPSSLIGSHSKSDEEFNETAAREHILATTTTHPLNLPGTTIVKHDGRCRRVKMAK